MKYVLTVLISLAAIGVALGSFAQAAPEEPDGAAIFKTKCSMCHGQDGKGFAAIKTPDFTDPKWQASVTDQQIFDTIKGGSKKNTMMVAFGSQLKDDEIHALVKQIRSFNSAKK
ncbi:MAG TPA: c-type cytochrome [Terriglobia bacterium]|nr:c-type cytochrome [Terriglobia bacterium]